MSQSDSEELYLYELQEDLLNKYDRVMKLKIFVDSTDDELKNKYAQAIYSHHLKLQNNIDHIDAGFDLFTPDGMMLKNWITNEINYQVICSATILKQMQDCRKVINTGFYMYPRSSISKTNIRLANNVGIIDAGYRGHLKGMFDFVNQKKIKGPKCPYGNFYWQPTKLEYDKDIPSTEYINKFERHLQICAPGLIPIMVTMVATKEELGVKTARGEGGFGSTGK